MISRNDQYRTLVDGQPQTTVAFGDRGLQYGDGLFETFAVVDGAPCLWVEHLARLRLGCERLGLPLPDASLLESEARQLTQGHERGVLKLLYTRGAGGRGYRPSRDAAPTRVLAMSAAPEHPVQHWRDGVSVRWCRLRLSAQPALAGLKHLNRLEQVLARMEWDDPAIAEGLMLDQNDRVVEGTQTNVFALVDGELLTPRLDTAGVRGVMRAVIAELASARGVPCRETWIEKATLERAEEIFLCNSIVGLWSVRDVEGRVMAGQALAQALLGELRRRRICLLPSL